MKKSIILLLLGLHCFTFSKNISLIIPCHARHIKFLDNLLQIYEQQSMLPHQVVIAVSEVSNNNALLAQLAEKKWLFDLQIISTQAIKTAGQNRNIACAQANGDIFILQDADDIPHPQRVEIIHYFFEKYDVDHLQHKWDYNASWHMIKNVQSIDYIHINYHEDCYGQHYVQGTPAISRTLFQQLKWDNKYGEDTRFNGNAYKLTEKTILIPLILYQYRKPHRKPHLRSNKYSFKKELYETIASARTFFWVSFC